ncbi:carbohydrate kinase family protein [Yersinia vastinensis]|uniref:carbohydrate kinase family protein n=1 Tax=Yersinia vastinensis TaxID=2890318 RepID=UPI0005DB4C9F|nr:PfkB family carbohydrate kinase [Yersinia vastinensis]OVZ96076.1 kinase [Yersinia frederiksenii]CNI76419.1 carbohydrate kinase [Yersinia frederiksenii]
MAILSVGFSCFDQFFFINHWPEENTKNFSHDFIESGGGPCANAAWLLGLWGENIHYIGHLNQDIYGQRIVDEFSQVGVNTDNIVFSDEMITPLASILVNRLNGSRTIITRKLQVPPSLTFDQKLKLDDFAEQLIAKNEEVTILIDGHEPEISEYLIKKLPRARVVMDGGSLRKSNLHLAQFTDHLVASEHFARDYLGITEFKSESQLKTALQELNKICRGEAYITLGEKGCAFLKNGLLQIVPAFVCNTVDTTGAGDIFHGAFTYGIHYSWHIDNIILFASLAAAIAIEKKGVRESMPDLSVVHKSLTSYERNLQQYFED